MIDEPLCYLIPFIGEIYKSDAQPLKKEADARKLGSIFNHFDLRLHATTVHAVFQLDQDIVLGGGVKAKNHGRAGLISELTLDPSQNTVAG